MTAHWLWLGKAQRFAKFSCLISSDMQCVPAAIARGQCRQPESEPGMGQGSQTPLPLLHVSLTKTKK